jgi:hypothetical protein
MMQESPKKRTTGAAIGVGDCSENSEEIGEAMAIEYEHSVYEAS